MAYAILTIYTLVIIVRYYRNRSTIGLFFAWMMLAPAVTFFGRIISSSYVMIIALTPFIFLKGGKIRLPCREIRQYLWMLLSINVIYVFSWLIFSRKNPGGMTSVFMGAVKNSLLILFCWIMNAREFHRSLLREVSMMVRWVLFLNTAAIIYQMIDPVGASQILDKLLNESQIELLGLAFTSTGQFGRHFGIFSLPIMMGVFSLLALIYVVLIDQHMNKLTKVLCCFATLFGGLMAASKTYIYGALFLLVLLGVRSFMLSKMTVKKILIGSALAASVVMLFVFNDQLYALMSKLFGPSIAHPLQFMKLERLTEIFQTRLDPEKGTLMSRGTWDVIKRYFLFGVGVPSIENEPVNDNEFFVVMHSGGLLCMSIVLFYYGRILWKNRRDIDNLVAMLVFFATGTGFDTWTHPMWVWIVFSVEFKHYCSYNILDDAVPDGPTSPGQILRI